MFKKHVDVDTLVKRDKNDLIKSIKMNIKIYPKNYRVMSEGEGIHCKISSELYKAVKTVLDKYTVEQKGSSVEIVEGY